MGLRRGTRRAARALLFLLALAPTAAHASEPAPAHASGAGWLVGTASGPAAARSLPGARIAPGIRAVRGGAAAARRLRRLPGVRWVERNRRYFASSLAAPSDPLFGRQWALRSARVHDAWLSTVGAEVPVAVLDSGIDFSNLDLAGNLWTNPAEVPGNRVDDDRNGYVDDVHGADTVNGDGDPGDGLGHGTAVAGVIGARGDNGVGISGVAWSVRLMPVKVLHDEGWATTTSIVAGLRYALAHGARVVNMSLNGPQSSQALDEAIAQAEAQGALVIASAGNDGANRDRVASYPASVRSGAVLSVASANRAGRLARGSAYGRGSVDIAAPGADVITCELGGRCVRRSGTSFAAAHVSGAAALLAAARPDVSGGRLRAALVASARRGGRVDGAIAGGQLDVTAALERLGRLRSP